MPKVSMIQAVRLSDIKITTTNGTHSSHRRG